MSNLYGAYCQDTLGLNWHEKSVKHIVGIRHQIIKRTFNISYSLGLFHICQHWHLESPICTRHTTHGSTPFLGLAPNGQWTLALLRPGCLCEFGTQTGLGNGLPWPLTLQISPFHFTFSLIHLLYGGYNSPLLFRLTNSPCHVTGTYTMRLPPLHSWGPTLILFSSKYLLICCIMYTE